MDNSTVTDVFDIVNYLVSFPLLVILFGIMFKEIKKAKNKKPLVFLIVFSIIALVSYIFDSYRNLIDPSNNLIGLVVVCGISILVILFIPLFIKYKAHINKKLYWIIIILGIVIGFLLFLNYIKYVQLKSLNAVLATIETILFYFFSIDFLINLKKIKNR
jgi:hypothetical protein